MSPVAFDEACLYFEGGRVAQQSFQREWNITPGCDECVGKLKADRWKNWLQVLIQDLGHFAAWTWSLSFRIDKFIYKQTDQFLAKMFPACPITLVSNLPIFLIKRPYILSIVHIFRTQNPKQNHSSHPERYHRF